MFFYDDDVRFPGGGRSWFVLVVLGLFQSLFLGGPGALHECVHGLDRGVAY